jgi:hypothetical protein
VAAEGETAATAAVVVVGEWADAAEDEAVVARRPRRRDERRRLCFFFMRTIPSKRYPVCDKTVLYGSKEGQILFVLFSICCVGERFVASKKCQTVLGYTMVQSCVARPTLSGCIGCGGGS